MKTEKRNSPRFTNIARVEAPELCALPGVLDDISSNGCKVHFPVPFDVNLENDCQLEIRFSHKLFSNPLELIGRPKWFRLSDCETYVGFSFLRSPDTPKLNEFIEVLKNEEEDKDDEIFIQKSEPDFID